jgi:hypothetical protein
MRLRYAEPAMCVQCMLNAAASVGAASGIRTWLGIRGGAWLTPGRMRAITIALLTLAVLGAGVGLSGSS